MCGILGQVGNIDYDKFVKALSTIQYRGPDHSQTLQEKNVILGHNRLSIIDLNERSNQPFASKNKRFILIFNGEIYNFRKVKSLLSERGYEFDTTSDTEVVINAFDAWGVEAFSKLYGMFAAAIYDTQTNTLTLVRDRVGEKPLFYSNTNQQFVFGSELKALKPLISTCTFSHESLIDYLTFGYVPTPKSIYQEICKLKPGHYLQLDCNTLQIKENKPYYILDTWSNATKKPLPDLLHEFDKVVTNVAEEIAISDVPYGAFLSGGVDSSGATAILKKVNPNIRAFTIGFEDKQQDESHYASQVAQHLDIEHVVKKVDMEEVKHIYEQMVKLYDEPFNDFSFLPTYHVCKKAKEFATMVISGDGADELFCGYRKYHRLLQLQKIYPLTPLRKAIRFASGILPESTDIKRQLYRVGLSANHLMYDMMSIVFKERELDYIAGPKLNQYRKSYSSKGIIDHHLSQMPQKSSLLQKLRYLDIKMNLVDDMLVKVDRASMFNSLEVRPFFLHPDILNFASTLEDKYLATPKISKWFLKKYFESHLPHNILYRTKMGFTPPLSKWILSDLRPLFEEAVSYLPEGLFNTEKVYNLVHLQEKGQRDFIMQIHSILFLGIWFKFNA